MMSLALELHALGARDKCETKTYTSSGVASTLRFPFFSLLW